MTGTYEWNPMSHILDVRCPECRGRARFEFAEAVQIRSREDLSFFKKSPQFEYRFVRARHAGQNWNAAFYFAGLHGRASTSIHSLPDGYEPSEWDHRRTLYRPHGLDLGSLVCTACAFRRRHELQWPADAYFRIEYRGEVLWAFHRESAVDLRTFVASPSRQPKKLRWASFLLHVPTVFLTAKARPTVLKRLDRMLEPL